MRRPSSSLDLRDLTRLSPGVLILPGLLILGCIDPRIESRVGAAIVDTCNGVGDGALCNDQNPCTLGDTCQAGVCVGTPAADGTACTDGNQCTGGDACDQGTCKGVPLPDGTGCTDGEPCTDPDVCTQGACVSGPAKVCDDGIACTLDHCVVGVGCRSDVTAQCPDGDAGGVSDATVDDAGGDVSPPSERPDVGQPDGMDATPAPDADAAGSPDTGGPADADAAADTGLGRDADEVGDGAGTTDGDGRAPTDADGSTPADGGIQPDAGADGGDGAAPDAALDTADDRGTADGPRQFAVRGGACVCGIATAPSEGAWLLWIGGALALLAGRRRRA